MKITKAVTTLWYYWLILFVEGASLMVVELLGAKLLAPFYGSSLYVWTAVLSITIIGLTLGYHFGGKLTQKKALHYYLGLIFIACLKAIRSMVGPHYRLLKTCKLTLRLLEPLC